MSNNPTMQINGRTFDLADLDQFTECAEIQFKRFYGAASFSFGDTLEITEKDRRAPFDGAFSIGEEFWKETGAKGIFDLYHRDLQEAKVRWAKMLMKEITNE